MTNPSHAEPLPAPAGSPRLGFFHSFLARDDFPMVLHKRWIILKCQTSALAVLHKRLGYSQISNYGALSDLSALHKRLGYSPISNYGALQINV